VWTMIQLIPMLKTPEDTWESSEEQSFAFPQPKVEKNGVIAGHVSFSPVSPTPIMMTMIMYI
jgi:hypothetical protein